MRELFEIERLAYHEAGHAVMATVLPGMPEVERATLHSTETRGGQVRLSRPELDAMRRGGTFIYRAMLLAASGALAEALVRATRGRPCGESERSPDRALLSTLAMDYKREKQAEGMRSGDAQRAACRRLALALAATEFHLRAHWPAVDALARALLRHGTLSGDRVRAIVAGTPRRWLMPAEPEREVELLTEAAADPWIGRAWRERHRVEAAA